MDAALGFPTWVVFGFVGATTLNAIVNRGASGFAWSLLCSAAGALFWVLGGGFYYAPATSELVTALCAIGSFGYMSAVAYMVHQQTRRVAVGRDARMHDMDAGPSFTAFASPRSHYADPCSRARSASYSGS